VTLEEFLAPPTREAWYAELGAGWSGPDGSSWSFDDVMGVRIGITSRLWRHAHYPANRHDWRYHLGRKHRLPENYRAAADAEYRDGCAASVCEALIGWRVQAGRARAYARWAFLRAFGRHAWRKGS
jgi:hypothetical protein